MTAIGSARAVADAVLFEGYLLYPYRADDAKNQVRWQFGVLAPPAFVDLDPSERSWLKCESVLEGRDVKLIVQVRFLQVQRRSVARAQDGEFTAVEALEVSDATFLPCEEAVVVERSVEVSLAGLEGFSTVVDISVAGAIENELLYERDCVVGRLNRIRSPLSAVLRIDACPLVGPYGVRRLRIRLENQTQWASAGTAAPYRPSALRCSLVAAHLLIAAQHGTFVSQIDPAEWAQGYVAENEQVGCFPVLAGPADAGDLVLASPIILYDHPQLAPESDVQFCDATEMDEMLTLRTLTLTDAEKRLVRGSDPLAAALVDHVDHLPPQLLERLHGAIRGMTGVPLGAEMVAPKIQGPTAFPEPTPDAPWWDPGQDRSVDPERDLVMIDGVAVGRGVCVRLRPGARSADAQDMFLEGRLATVEAVLFDVDGNTHLAVALDDLLEDGYNPHGRFLYFAPDEVEPMQVNA